MGKDKFMDGRNEGMAFALQIAKEKGIDGLEQEVKMRGLTNLPTKVSKKALDECVLNIKNNVIDTFVILLAATLHDEFGFGEKRVQKALNAFTFKAECIGDDYCTWQDYIQVIKEELNIELDIRENNKNVSC